MMKTMLRQVAPQAGIARCCLNTAMAVTSSCDSPSPPSTSLRPWLFVGLGNPGEKFRSTRHNTGPLAAYYKLQLDRIVLVFDDMSLPCGVLRLQLGGGHGGHNGLKNVIHHFRGNKEFGRLRIGIGRPPGQMDPKAFVLQKFNATARDRIDAALTEGARILKAIVHEGLTESSRSANTEQKYKHLRLKSMPQ